MLRFYSLLGVLLLSICLTGCEEPFRPLKESDALAFSIQGYLDASADTQWVRVAPVRDRLEMPPVKPSMRVTLTELETGRSTVMNDSLVRWPNDVNFISAWTTMDVKPEHAYRLAAERPDGTTSSITMSTPADFPTPELSSSCRLTFEGVERLADVQWVHHYIIKGVGERVFRFPRRDVVRQEDTNAFSLLVRRRRDDPEIILPEGDVVTSWSTIFVASGGPEWDDRLTSLDDLTYALPDGLSNVQNGVGYVVGIVSKTIPFECDS